MEKVNILLIGATGSGKSSTINALLKKDYATVGYGSYPETMDINKYEYGDRVLWDSPGLGDGLSSDIEHSRKIIAKLLEVDSNGFFLIDQVIVIVDGSSKDLGTTYKLLETVVLPNIGNNSDRLLVAINQADRAMKGRHWDYKKGRPDPVLEKFLEKKKESVRNRILMSTGMEIEVIYYSATSY